MRVLRVLPVLPIVMLGEVAGCGSDDGGEPIDAMPIGPPTVHVLDPNGVESFYPSAMVNVQWVATGRADLTALVEATDGTTTTMIATGVAATSGTTMTTPWSLAGLVEAATYKIRVTVTDGDGMTAMDTSDGNFAIRAPEAVMFASQVQPIFTSNCAGSSCHDNSQPAAGLQLTAGSAYAELVDTSAMECPNNKLVDPGKPEASYLQFKLDGSGPCFSGASMPLGGQLTPMQIQMVRDWIQTGAPDN